MRQIVCGSGVVKCGYGWVDCNLRCTITISHHCVGMDLFVIVIVLMDRIVHDTPFVVAVAVVHVDCSCGTSCIVTQIVLLNWGSIKNDGHIACRRC